MKNSKFFIFISFVLINFFALAQTNKEKATQYYKKGVKMFNNRRYIDADIWFSKSIDMFPLSDTYYNLAMTKMVLKDTCTCCKYLMNAAKLMDFEAIIMFEEICLVTFIADFDNKLHKDSSFYASFTIYPCIKKIVESEYHIKDLNTNVISTYKIIGTDSSVYNEKSFPGVFPKFYYFKPDLPVFSSIENMPTYPGGDDARIKFIGENMRYPQKAKESGIQGTIYVTFIIEDDGSVSNVQILRGIGGGCDEEAIRVVKLMPKWNPGTSDGKPVRVQFNMPIKLTLANGHN